MGNLSDFILSRGTVELSSLLSPLTFTARRSVHEYSGSAPRTLKFVVDSGDYENQHNLSRKYK